MSSGLTERRQTILKLVIQEFVETAQPVASETLVRKYRLNVSPATVRNELAALEELGYLTHLHTSAGRVPTDIGYRFFVENLMDRTSLSLPEQRMIRHQFYQVRGELDQWIQLAGSVLARTAQNASVVTPPRSADRLRFRQVELVAIHDTMALAVLVFHGGVVKQQTLALDAVRSPDDLRRCAARISSVLADLELGDVEDLLTRDQQQEGSAEFGDFERQVLDLVARAMDAFEAQAQEQIYSDGLIEMLSQPEFIPALAREDAERAVERMRRALDILKSGRGLGLLIPQALASDGVQVIIGGENSADEMREYSVILARYGVERAVTGVLGVIGPTRMAYPRSISSVRYISSLMSDLLAELYQADQRLPES
ncbi:heat-inducible transcription repressor HrcA [Candidatus Chloroploca sp. M-50]|uniref:Heat-inducible transcription repressor HrcA n=1 Tax=Candidatus Chloroploca mongolica TaxID=2528176 RepID=A0ABS4DDB4_9CHLR|nr:heat-inducible transcriptional repressor HrcA [Candidatus Chloroploca mongolica]MBP1467413.1 heat-inducible transcription repressor HrcA [Candidatus Chloroploca mongolica]